MNEKMKSVNELEIEIIKNKLIILYLIAFFGLFLLYFILTFVFMC